MVDGTRTLVNPDGWWPPGHVLGWEHTFVFELRRRVSVDPGKAPRPLKGVERGGLKNFRQDPEQTSCIVNDTDCDWVLVQGHVSHAITDRDLATVVFGTALISEWPLQVACDDGSQPKPR